MRMSNRKWTHLWAAFAFAGLAFAVGCGEELVNPVDQDLDQQTVAEPAVGDQMPSFNNHLNLPSGGGSGAIFTTVPDGSIVNGKSRSSGCSASNINV